MAHNERDATLLREHVAAAARRLAHEGLLVGTAGNVSARDHDLVGVTASGVTLAGCRPEDVTLVSLDGAVVEGELRPTSELSLHLGIHAISGPDADAGAVVHTHAPYSTAAACVLDELPVLHYQQLLLGGAVRVAPYATFGTDELAESVRKALEGRQAALMANHGSVAIGATLEAAVDNALLLEWLATLHHRAAALGTPRVLTEAEQNAVIEAAMSRGYGTPQANEES
jgi:L-fuculose-phosphate aldolase